MQNRNVPYIVSSVASLLIMLFMPFMSFMGYSSSLWDVISEYGFDSLIESGSIDDIATVIALIGGVVAVVGGIINKRAIAQLGSGAAVVGCIVFLVSLLIDEVPIDTIMDVMGMGFWLSIIGFAISSSLAKNIRG